MIFTVEKKINGVWTRWRDAKDRESAQKAVDTARRCNPEDEWMVGEYVRLDPLRVLYLVQFQNTPPREGYPGQWRSWEPEGYETEETAREEVVHSQSVFAAVPHRIIRESASVEVIETFPPRTP